MEETNKTKDNHHLNNISANIINQKQLFSARLQHKQRQNRTELSNFSLRLNFTNKTSFYRPQLKETLTKGIFDGLSSRLTKANTFKERRTVYLLEKSQINHNSFVFQGKDMNCDFEKVAKDLNDITIALNNKGNYEQIKIKEEKKTNNYNCRKTSNKGTPLNQIRIKVKNKALAAY